MIVNDLYVQIKVVQDTSAMVVENDSSVSTNVRELKGTLIMIEERFNNLIQELNQPPQEGGGRHSATLTTSLL